GGPVPALWAPNWVFAFVVGDPESPAATWRYQFHPRREHVSHMAATLAAIKAAAERRPDS
ncbi:MAG: hypothetical protein ACRDV9_14375, partial [Acidimicrobiia bacterium]